MLQSPPMWRLAVNTVTFLSVLGLLVLGTAQLAWAEVAPLVPATDPPASAEITQRFHQALANGLRTGGLEVVAPETVQKQLNLPLENAGCAQGPCLSTAAGLVKAKRLATLNVRTVGKNYTVEVRLFEGKKQVAQANGRCDICTLMEAVTTVEQTAAEVGTVGEDPGAVEPPAVAPVVPPEPPVEAQPAESEKDATPAAENAADDQPGLGRSKGRSSRWGLWPGIVAGGVGVVALSIGIPLVAIDGEGTNCRGDARPDKRNCADLYDTGAGGWVLTSMGLASLATAGVLFYLHFTADSQEKNVAWFRNLSVGPSAEGGVLLHAAGRF